MRMACITLTAVFLTQLAAPGQEKKAATIKITIPESGYKDTVLTVDGGTTAGLKPMRPAPAGTPAS